MTSEPVVLPDREGVASAPGVLPALLCPNTDLLFAKDRVLVLERPLDWDAMRAAAPHVVGTHDYTAVRASGCQAKSPYTTVQDVTVERDPWTPGFFCTGRDDDGASRPYPDETSRAAAAAPPSAHHHHHPARQYEFWTIRIRARSFLYRMVRNLVGIFLEIGTGRRTPQYMVDVLRSAERSMGGPMRYTTAPAHGLYLTDVHYGNHPEHAGTIRNMPASSA